MKKILPLNTIIVIAVMQFIILHGEPFNHDDEKHLILNRDVNENEIATIRWQKNGKWQGAYIALFHLSRHSKRFTVRNHSPIHTLIHTPVYASLGARWVKCLAQGHDKSMHMWESGFEWQKKFKSSNKNITKRQQ